MLFCPKYLNVQQSFFNAMLVWPNTIGLFECDKASLAMLKVLLPLAYFSTTKGSKDELQSKFA